MQDHESDNLVQELQTTFGANVRARRLAAGLSQGELCARSGVPRDDISRIENGRNNVTLRTMARLSNALGTTVPKLLVR